MRILLVLILLGGLGFGAYYVFLRSPTKPANSGTGTPPPPPGTIAPQPPGYGTVLPPPPGSSTLPASTAAEPAELRTFEAAWTAAAAAGDPVQSADALSLARLGTAALRALRPEQADRAARLVDERLAPLAQQIFFGRKPVADDSGLFLTHTVVANESPDAIGKIHGMSTELVNLLRGADPQESRLQLNQKLKVLALKTAGVSMRIAKRAFTLDLTYGDVFVRRFAIAHGSPTTPTPVGTATIRDRVLHPAWTNPATNEQLPYGHPDHILGPIWLKLDEGEIGQAGIGIHGYSGTDPSIGTQASHGCIRLRNDDAMQLYYLIPPPSRATTTVTIAE